MRRVGFQLRQRHRIVELVDVAEVGLRPRQFRDFGLERQHPFRRVGGIGRADHLERALDVDAISVALFLVLVGEVIIAVRHPHPAGEHAADIHARISRVRQHADSEQGRAKVGKRGGHEMGELGLCRDRRDAVEVGLQRSRVELLEPRLVHVAGV